MASLTLSRKTGERIMIGRNVSIEVARVEFGRVYLRVHAPRGIIVDREEIRGRKMEEGTFVMEEQGEVLP